MRYNEKWIMPGLLFKAVSSSACESSLWNTLHSNVVCFCTKLHSCFLALVTLIAILQCSWIHLNAFYSTFHADQVMHLCYMCKNFTCQTFIVECNKYIDAVGEILKKYHKVLHTCFTMEEANNVKILVGSWSPSIQWVYFISVLQRRQKIWALYYKMV